jgi:outer membrane protein OmpA-like peptidoglycan-associated protein
MKKSFFTTTAAASAALIVLTLPCSFSQTMLPVAASPVNVAKNINTAVRGERLSFNVNTNYRELGPMPTKDGKRLYFSRQGFPENTGGTADEDIWYCDFQDETQDWGPAINVGPPLNNEGPNFITGVGRNGDTLLLANEYRKKGKMRAGVSVSVRVGQLWSFPVPVRIAADYNVAGRASYDLSHDRTTLIIAQQKADSYGKLDLYVAFRDPNQPNAYVGTESTNLGPVINSFGDETSPWLAYDGRTLYFASDGHNGFGNMDIFVSRRLDNTWTNWSEPENLGPGINSPYDDFSFNYNPTSRFAYFVRGFSRENTDILKVDMENLFLHNDDLLPEIGETKSITNVFDDNGSEIKPDALKDLHSIVEYLKKNSTTIIQITAHSNSHDSRNESLKLSNERAIKVMDYLVKNEIAQDRLTYNGLGHDVVVNTPASAADASGIGNVSPSTVEFKVISY